MIHLSSIALKIPHKKDNPPRLPFLYIFLRKYWKNS